MRKEERAKLALSTRENISKLKNADFKLLARAQDLTPVGIITSIETNWVSSIEDNRRLAKGLKLTDRDGVEQFEEYLDWYNPSSGKIENCICIENGIILVTARDGFNVENDPDNFTWLTDKSITKEAECDCVIVSVEESFEYDGEVIEKGKYVFGDDISQEVAQYVMEEGYGSARRAKAVCPVCEEPVIVDSNFSFSDSRELRNIKNTLEEIKRERNDIRRRMKELKSEKTDVETEAEERIAKMDTLEKRVEELREEKDRLKRQVDHYESILPEEMSDRLADASKSEEKMQRAEEVGRFEGKDKLSQAKNTLEEVSELKTKEEEIKSKDKFSEKVENIEKMISNSLESFDKRLDNVENNIKKLSKRYKKTKKESE